jgi:hypothetical protein
MSCPSSLWSDNHSGKESEEQSQDKEYESLRQERYSAAMITS